MLGGATGVARAAGAQSWLQPGPAPAATRAAADRRPRSASPLKQITSAGSTRGTAGPETPNPSKTQCPMTSALREGGSGTAQSPALPITLGGAWLLYPMQCLGEDPRAAEPSGELPASGVPLHPGEAPLALGVGRVPGVWLPWAGAAAVAGSRHGAGGRSRMGTQAMRARLCRDG